jgi:hypothetical protein
MPEFMGAFWEILYSHRKCGDEVPIQNPWSVYNHIRDVAIGEG